MIKERKWQHEHKFTLSDGRAALIEYNPPANIVESTLDYQLTIDGKPIGAGTHRGTWTSEIMEDFVRQKYGLQ